MCKLDMYVYEIIYADAVPVMILIHMNGRRDPDIGDIVTEINSHNGSCYVDGHYFLAGDIEVKTKDNRTLLTIDVKENLEAR